MIGNSDSGEFKGKSRNKGSLSDEELKIQTEMARKMRTGVTAVAAKYIGQTIGEAEGPAIKELISAVDTLLWCKSVELRKPDFEVDMDGAFEDLRKAYEKYREEEYAKNNK